MAKRRAGGGEEKGNWLDTYADMVTLLLCFFVLLYSASSVDETKWQYIYQSFTSSGSYINPFVMDEQPKNNAADTNGNAERRYYKRTDRGSSLRLQSALQLLKDNNG